MSATAVVTKRCCRCQVVRPADEFAIRRENLDGLASYCQPCRYEERHRPNPNARRPRSVSVAMLPYPPKPDLRRKLSDDELLALLHRMGGQVHRDEIAYQIRSRRPLRLADPLARLELAGWAEADGEWWTVTGNGREHLRRIGP